MNAFLAALVLMAAPITGELSVNRGEVRTGPALVHTFTFTNSTPHSLQVLDVSTPCGCLTTEVTPKHVKPGATAQLTITVNTLTPPAGANTWRGVVRVAPESRPDAPPAVPVEIPWALTANLVREIAIHPPAVAISAAEAAVTVPLKITDSRERPLKIESVQATHPGLRVTLQPVEPGTTLATLTLGTNTPTGVLRAEIVFHTNDPTCPELHLPVTITKRAPTLIQVTPAKLELVPIPGRKPITAAVQLRATGASPVRIESVHVDHPEVHATAAGAGRFAAVRVVVASETAGSAILTITLAIPVGEVIQVPITWGDR